MLASMSVYPYVRDNYHLRQPFCALEINNSLVYIYNQQVLVGTHLILDIPTKYDAGV